jgi:N(2)-fixation sustaining protein CowN
MSCCKIDPNARTDRYKSFIGIDCEGNARRVMALIDQHTVDLQEDKFWKYFHGRRHATSGPACDDLLLLASFVNPIRELFETRQDREALTLLEQLEDECF